MVTLLLSYKANTKIIDEVGRCKRAGVGMFVFFCAIFSFPHLQRRELVGVSASPSVSSSYIYRWMALSNRAQRCMYMYDYTTAYIHAKRRQRWMALSNRAQRCMYMYDYTTAYIHAKRRQCRSQRRGTGMLVHECVHVHISIRVYPYQRIVFQSLTISPSVHIHALCTRAYAQGRMHTCIHENMYIYRPDERERS